MPFFSIIMPCYNRATKVTRAIESCFNQTYQDFEIIVVDDGSTDNSIEVVRSFTDKRVKLIAHDKNRGVSPARNTGFENSTGIWAVFLDSDDELLPHALEVIHSRVANLADKIGAAWFSVRLDNGEVSPTYPLPETATGYEEYLGYLEKSFTALNERLHCARVSTYPTVRWPDDRMVVEAYHLDFAKRFLSANFTDVLRLYHQDADNQITRLIGRVKWRQDTRVVSERARGMATMMEKHGAALKKYAPKRYQKFLGDQVRWEFLTGNRVKGIILNCKLLQVNPKSPRPWAFFVLGIIGPIAFSLVDWLRQYKKQLKPTVIPATR